MATAWIQDLGESRTTSRWQVRWREDGGRMRAKRFARKPDAERFAAQLAVDVAQGTYVSPAAGKITVAAWWSSWSQLQVQWSAGTRERNVILWSKHIAPRIGSRQVGAVRHSELQSVITASQLAPATTKLLRSLMASMFRAAVSDDLIAKSPADGLKVPTGAVQEPRPLDTDEVERLLAACSPFEHAWVHTGLSTGVRISEGLAIRLATIDFPRREIRIADQARTPQVGPVELAPLKTARKTGSRIVPLTESLSFELARHIAEERERRGPELGRLGLLFPGADGGLCRRQAATERFAGIVRRAGLGRDVTWHCVRDTAATNMLRDGVNPTYIAEVLGNTVPVLLGRYAGVLPDDIELARASLDRITARAVAL